MIVPCNIIILSSSCPVDVQVVGSTINWRVDILFIGI